VAARVVVVGAGVLGSMHAYHALAAGHDVVLIEREDAPRGASVRNFGLIWVSGRRGGDELELALRARRLWEEIAAEVPRLGFRANGSLTIAQTEAELRVLEEVTARDDADRRELALLDAAELREVNPAVRGDTLAALHCRLDAAVEPRRVPEALRAHLDRAPGFRHLPRRHVVEVGEGWVRDHRGEVHAGDVVVVCPGAAHRGFAGWDGDAAPLRRVRLQMLETAPLDLPLTTSLADGDSLRYYPVFDVPALAELPEPPEVVAAYALQLLVQQRLDGSLTVGDTHVYDEPFDVATAEDPYLHLARRVESILGRPMPAIRKRWAGVYSQAAPDVLYHREPLGERTVVVTGAGGRGVTLSPAIAEEVLGGLGIVEAYKSTRSSTAR
jgi:FAD dependent oxidoreductase TIGR03364